MSDDGTDEGPGLRLGVRLDGDWMEHRVVASPEGTAPSAYIILAINPDAPNAYTEFEAISAVFTEEFMAISGAAMRAMVEAEVEKSTDEEVANVVVSVKESMVMQGFTPEEADAIAATSAIGERLEEEG